MSAEIEADAVVKDPPPSRGWRTIGRIGAVVGILAAVASIIAVIGELTSSSPPGLHKAVLKIDRVEAGVPLGTFLKDSNVLGSVYKYRRADLSQRGTVVYSTLTLAGLKGRSAVVKWSLFDRSDGRRFADARYHDQIGNILTAIPSNEDGGALETWVPVPHRREKFFIQLEVFDDKGQSIGEADAAHAPGAI